VTDPVFLGADPGRWGGVCRLICLPNEDDLRVIEVLLAPLPVAERDGGGHEVEARALANLVWGYEYARIVVERPAVGGGMQRGAASVTTQCATFGEVLAVLKLTDRPVDQQPSSASTRRELGLPTVPRGGDRKAANLADAEALLERWSRAGCALIGPPVARGYRERIGGCKEARSGMADALLLAWLGARRWMYGTRRKR
jgi:hypothetical protein